MFVETITNLKHLFTSIVRYSMIARIQLVITWITNFSFRKN